MAKKIPPNPTNITPPQNTDAEASLLGAILIDTDAIVKIADSISVQDFFDPRHARIYEALLALYEKRSSIDVLTLADQLKGTGFLDMVGGPAYLTELTNYVPTASHVEQYAEIVAQKALRRRLIAASADMASMSQDEAKPIKELIEEAESRLFEVSQQHIKQTVVGIDEILTASFERLDDLHKDKKKIRGIPTGYKDIDDTLAGLQRSDLFVLAARPSMGKAQPLDANILTINGWKQMGSVQIGDQLASVDGTASEVTGVFPQGIEQVYRVGFSDGRSAEFSGEHLWTVHYRTWDKPRVLTTNQIAKMLTRRRYQGRLWIDMFTGVFGGEASSSSTSQTDQAASLPIAPWALGALIGEGDFGSLRFSTASPHMLQQLEVELGEDYRLNHAGNYDYRIVQTVPTQRHGAAGTLLNPLRAQLKALNLWGKRSHEKHIPTSYMNADYSSRLQLLQGLLDADGWVETFGTVRFTSSSEQLAQDVVTLARSLGAWCTIHPKRTSFTYRGEHRVGLLSYVVCIVHPEPHTLFSLPEKRARTRLPSRRKRLTFSEITPSRQTETQCISVSHPSELYVTDDFIVTHNTAFVLNLAHNVAVDAKEPVLIFSLEMSKEQLVDRLLSMQSGVDAWALRTGNLTDSDFEKLADAMGVLGEAPIYIDDTPGITVSDLRTKARREAHQRQPGLIVVDYLQLMSGGSRFSGEGNRVQEISEISRGLKGVARELNVPLIALSQLSRSVESRSPQIPQLADLRESGSIEQDADIVAFIYREDYYNPETERKNITDILIKKHRNGALRNVELYFDRDKQRFRSLDTSHASNPFGDA
jgi:replicative DNA helicase